MRPLVGLGVLVALASACSDEKSKTAVVPGSIEVSPDRRTLVVATSYPTSIDCGLLPGGLDVEVNDGVALIIAMMRSAPGDGEAPSNAVG